MRLYLNCCCFATIVKTISIEISAENENKNFKVTNDGSYDRL